MATTTAPTQFKTLDVAKANRRAKPLTAYGVLDRFMQGLASLKLTVALFAFGIFVVLVGTLAQTEADIWIVVARYFRSWIMWVDLGLFLPPSFFPELHRHNPGLLQFFDKVLIPMPGGMTVGVLMAVNLVAAHAWRFKIQASGVRLAIGVAVIVAGLFLTTLVIFGGHNAEGFQAVPWFSWSALWYGLVATTLLTWLAGLASTTMWVVRKSSAMTRRHWTIIGVLSIVLVVVPSVVLYALGRDLSLAPESLRILYQLMQGGLAGLVLLGGCVLVFRKRAGVVLLHGGIGLMMIGELVVSRYAVESQVLIKEGETASYTRDIRTTELAVIDPSGDEDKVVVVPLEVLERNLADNINRKQKNNPVAYISNRQLPFDIAVVDYYKNHDYRDLKKGETSVATTGRGLRETVVVKEPAKGTDTDSKTDFAAAYVRLRDKTGGDLGTYLLSQFASEQGNAAKFAEKATVNGKQYDLFLRFRRDYKPYAITLLDVRKDDYLGTNTPMNYSSQVHVVDESRGVDREVKIWMNNPLRYAGETFYQQGYNQDPSGAEYTTLAVVKNTGWMIPYVACMLVAVGMCAHFLIILGRFINRTDDVGKAVFLKNFRGANAPPVKGAKGRATQAPSGGRDPYAAGEATELAQRGGRSIWESIGLPILAAGLFAITVGYYARPAKLGDDGMDFVAFGKLPIVDSGRVKPLDTYARNTLRTMSDREQLRYTHDDETEKIAASKWLLEAVTGSDASFKYPVFRIEDSEVLQLFGLEPRPGNFRYSAEELRPKIPEFVKQISEARKVDKAQWTGYQRKLFQLHERMAAHQTLVEAFSQPRLPPLPTEETFKADPAQAQRQVDQFRLALSDNKQRLDEMKPPLVIPVAAGKDAKVVWQAYPTAWTLAFMQTKILGEEPDANTIGFEKILAAYSAGDSRAFNAAVRQYDATLLKHRPEDWNPNKTNVEAAFNQFSPFYVGVVLYVLAFLLAIFGFLFDYKPLGRAAFTMLLLTFIMHTVALGLRIYISGRPPVTNLYSSAVFIGWAAVGFGLLIEAFYDVGLGNLLASVAGFATLIVAYFLAAGGDTIAVLQAVLDTQFWLATHVVIVTLGYAATFTAGLFGLFYVVFGVLSPRLDDTMRKNLGRMIYGTVCFAILFSFVGTVLGGLWADDSWGRFWGWDPKENGALIIVLWNALVLHARWGKMVGDRGLAVLAIGGNIVTAWSWFGVNELGIGLHSYGFTDGVLLSLGLFVLSQMAFITLGLLPTNLWWSMRAHGSADTTAAS